MNCADCRQELELSFGQAEFDATVSEHLAQCANCRTYWAELAELAGSLPGDDAFMVDAATVEMLALKVDKTIDAQESKGKTTSGELSKQRSLLTWMRLLPAAAALLLVIGIGSAGYLLGRFDNRTTTITGNGAALEISQAMDDDYSEPDDPTVRLLLYDFASDRLYDASETLLDDITEEELRHLEQNFEVGDLL